MPTPTATPTPAPREVLYQVTTENEEFSSWGGAGGWNYLDGMLVNDGTNNPGRSAMLQELAIFAPFDPSPWENYAVEAEIQSLESGQFGTGTFGIVARVEGETGYWFGHLDDYTLYGLFIGEGDSYSDVYADYLDGVERDPGTEWHTYRIEVVGNSLRLLVDGAVILQATDNRHLSPGRVGLFSRGAQISVRSFKVILLGNEGEGAGGSEDNAAVESASTQSDEIAPPSIQPAGSAGTASSLPPSFVGTWSGEGTQTGPPMDWPIMIMLTPGEVGSVVGSVQYPSLGCGGQLRLDAIDTGGTLLLSEDITIGEGTCVDGGQFTLSPPSTGVMEFAWSDPDGESIATGDLES